MANPFSPLLLACCDLLAAIDQPVFTVYGWSGDTSDDNYGF